MTTRLPVSEVFGPVWQGEGPHTGRRCSFLRLGLCNLACEWCDTPFTWDTTRFDVHAECPPRDVPWVQAALVATGTTHLILSGGEPLIHAKNSTLLRVLDWWWFNRRTVDVETNGTLPPPEWAHMVDLFTVSPKLWTGGPARRRLRPDTLRAWEERPNSVFKVVCQTPEQVAEVAEQPWADPAKTWIMPEGITAERVLTGARAIEQAVADHGFHFTLRAHTLLHNDERGH